MAPLGIVFGHIALSEINRTGQDGRAFAVAWGWTRGRDGPRVLLVALLARPLPMPPLVDAVLGRLAETLAPLALLSVGLQLRLDALREHGRALALGLGYKLMLAPALVVAVLCLAGGDAGMVSRVSVIEAAMPPMIGAGIVAAQANLAPRLVAMMVGVGVPLGLVTACGWHLAFELLAR